ncbi:protein SFI1 homolog [Orycteropus afer afer]|uniref:Protein SFI1 homolog n=1 Tax=Orycteropus afer afer TaxID=1230840 RepID=A0AC54ZES6_ORYAF|nr:protein SFI1 homolog [Orycteropus afer afer]
MEKKIDSRSFRDGAVKKPCSLRILSSKKPSAFCGIRTQLPSPSHPVQRYASHTWNRRGRLRELRIRCVARKFLYLWIRKTFGRVFPAKARFYYKQRVLQKVFGEWKEEWWVSNREWKLCVRADCHYRYYLYNLMFQTWKTYMEQQQEMRNKYMRAKDHDAKQKMHQAWKSWLIYVVVRRTKHQMQTTALEFRQRSLLWVWWSEWRRRLEQILMGHALYISAVKHRALSLQLQPWEGSPQVAVSVAEMAERFHRVTVLQTHFCDWQWAWERRESLYARRALVGLLAKRMALRRAFAHWKHCSFGLRALRSSVAQTRLQQIRRNLAYQQHEATLLRRFWDCWQFRVEQREELEQRSFLRTAWNHYRVTLLRRCVRLWSQHIHQKHCKQLLQARADGHFQRRALPAAFQAWRRLWRWRQHAGALNTTATYQDWVRHVLREVAARESQHHRRLLRGVLHRWRENTVARVDEAKKASQARDHYTRTICSKVLAWWREAAAVQVYYRQQEDCAVSEARRALDQGCVQTVFRRWRDRSQSVARQRVQLERAARHHQCQLLRGAVVQWKAYHLGCIRDTLLQRQGAWLLAQRLGRSCFRHWRRQLATVRGEQRSTARALWFWSLSLQAKAWGAWRDFVLERRRKKARLERATQAHHQRLLQEGTARLLRFSAAAKAARQQLRAQEQAQAARSLHRTVRHCAMRWKQKVLGPAREPLAPAPNTPSRRVTFEVPLLSPVAAGAGDTALETKRPGARPERVLGSLALAAGDAPLLELEIWNLPCVHLPDGLPNCTPTYPSPGRASAPQVARATGRCLGSRGEPPGLVAPPPQSTSDESPSVSGGFLLQLLGQVVVETGRATAETQATNCRRIVRPSFLWDLVPGPPSAYRNSPVYLPRNAARLARKQPRRPNFVLEPDQSQRAEKARECGLGMAQPASGSLPKPFLAEAQTAPAPHSTLPRLRALPRPPGPKLPPTASAGPQPVVLPPSPFTPCGAETAGGVSAGRQPQATPSLAGAHNPHLLFPGDFTGTRAHPGLSSEAAGDIELEIELEGIRQQLQHYQTTKQNLWSCQRQAGSLRRWLELSREEPRPGDQEAERQVQKELEEVEAQLQCLAAEIQAQRRPVAACLARVRALQQALR